MTTSELYIRKATEKDIDTVYSIEQNCLNLWKRDYFLQELENTFSLFLVAIIKNKIIGYIVAWDVVDEIQIQNITISVPFRKNGYGTYLLKEAIEIFSPLNKQSLFLEVHEKNTTAQNFYSTHGFKIIGERKDYYTSNNNTGNAILMQKVLS